MRDLGTLGGPRSFAYEINERSQIIGVAFTKVGYLHAFVWEKGTMRDLGTLGGRHSNASGINERDQIIGWARTKTVRQHAVLWTLRSG